jgi:hypothetical protein
MMKITMQGALMCSNNVPTKTKGGGSVLMSRIGVKATPTVSVPTRVQGVITRHAKQQSVHVIQNVARKAIIGMQYVLV